VASSDSVELFGRGDMCVRQVIRSRSVSVEYALTKLGKTFVDPLDAICRWVDRHGGGLSANIRLPNE
jgi:DNA-binding HxlR family transcriptional regulator